MTQKTYSNKWPTLDEQRKRTKHLLKRKERFPLSLRRYQKENVPKLEIGKFWFPKQIPRNYQTVISGNEHSDTIIVPKTQNSLIPTNNKHENNETNVSLFHSQGATNGNQSSGWFCILTCQICIYLKIK